MLDVTLRAHATAARLPGLLAVYKFPALQSHVVSTPAKKNESFWAVPLQLLF